MTQPGLLQNITILDLSRVLAGPYCTMLLGDLGADVLKVELPGTGDPSRAWGPPWVGPFSAYYLSTNRNKRSITLNLKHEKGREILRGMAAKADILVENFLPGTLDQLGIGYTHLKAIKPDLIYCAITGYGQTGPLRDQPGFDFMIQAQGGIMSVTGPEEGAPHKVGVAIADVTTGLYASTAILGALHHRTRTGEGQYIDLALFDAQLGWLVNVAHNYFATGETPVRYGNAHPNIVPYEIFKTRDDYLALAIGTDAQYERFVHGVERPDLWKNPAYRTNASRVENRTTLVAQLSDIIAERTTNEWLELAAGLGIPAAPVNDVPGALNHPQASARAMVQSIEHPEHGPIMQLGPVPHFRENPAALRLPPPALGEHTAEVLAELGYTEEDIERFRDDGVV